MRQTVTVKRISLPPAQSKRVLLMW